MKPGMDIVPLDATRNSSNFLHSVVPTKSGSDTPLPEIVFGKKPLKNMQLLLRLLLLFIIIIIIIIKGQR
jgi:hypothetical protein